MSANNSFAKLLQRECHRRGNTAFSRNSAQVRQNTPYIASTDVGVSIKRSTTGVFGLVKYISTLS